MLAPYIQRCASQPAPPPDPSQATIAERLVVVIVTAQSSRRGAPSARLIDPPAAQVAQHIVIAEGAQEELSSSKPVLELLDRNDGRLGPTPTEYQRLYSFVDCFQTRGNDQECIVLLSSVHLRISTTLGTSFRGGLVELLFLTHGQVHISYFF